MSQLIATREALERFEAELPVAGAKADRLRRLAAGVRAMADQALADGRASGPPTAWLDHDLAVIVSEGLEHRATRAATRDLFLGVRRRLARALASDASDLTCALALARGATTALEDERIGDDVDAVVGTLGHEGAGPSLIGAAVQLVVAAGETRKGVAAGRALAAAAGVREAMERVATRLPAHPDVALDRARLAVLDARRRSGEERLKALEGAHAHISDHERRFGPSRAARDLLARVLELRARSGAPVSDVRRDCLALLDARARDGSLGPRAAERLVKAVERAGALDRDTAAAVLERLEPLAADHPERWRGAIGRALAKSGDEGAVVTHWERALADDPSDREAARGLGDRLLRNLRAGLDAPFDSAVLERVLEALPHGSLARWSAADAVRVLEHVQRTFGVGRALELLEERFADNRELAKHAPLWERGLALASEAGDPAGLETLARKAIKASGLPAARLALAEALLSAGRRLDEADDVLRPLYDAKGDLAARAHALRRRLSKDPGFRSAKRDALVAFEERVGVGSGRKLKLRILHTTASYALAEVASHQAPDVYGHKYLRVMVRADDLPKGVGPAHLRKGDKLDAPIRGVDGDPHKDRDTLRLYWIADSRALRLVRSPAELEERLDEEERRFGIGGSEPLPLRVGRQGRRKALRAHVLSRKQGPEFSATARISADQLPEGVDSKALGRGRRFLGVVERERGTEDGPGLRHYHVVGSLSAPKESEAKPKAVANEEATKAEPKEAEAQPKPDKEAAKAEPDKAEAKPEPEAAEAKPEPKKADAKTEPDKEAPKAEPEDAEAKPEPDKEAAEADAEPEPRTADQHEPKPDPKGADQPEPEPKAEPEPETTTEAPTEDTTAEEASS